MKIKNKKKFTLIASTVLGLPLVGSVAAVAVSCKKPDSKKDLSEAEINKNAVGKFQDYYKSPVNDTEAALVTTYQALVRDGAKLLVCPGFNQAAPIKTALKDRTNFANTGFLLLDANVQTDHTSQVASATFRTDQGSFLVGIALAQYLNDHKDVLGIDDGHGNKKLTWGGFGGMNFSSVTSYLVGMQAGIRFFNEFIQPKQKDALKVEQVLLGSTQNDNFSGNFGETTGDPLIEKFLNQGVSALFVVAGPQSISAVKKVKQKQSKTVIIGVDSQFEYSDAAKDQKIAGTDLPIVPFSSVKKLDVVAQNVLEAINLGKNYEENVAGSNFGGLGYKSLGDLNNNSVGVSVAGQKYLSEAIHSIDSSVAADDYEAAANYVKKQDSYLFTASDKGGVYFVTDEYANKKTFADIKADVEASGSAYETALSSGQNSGNGFFIYNDLPSTGSAYAKETPESKFTLKGYIKKWTAGTDKDSERDDELKLTKLVLNSSTSVLQDQSFSQTSYIGMFLFLRKYGLNIPLPPHSVPLLPKNFK